jgi:hypothetical protein
MKTNYYHIFENCPIWKSTWLIFFYKNDTLIDSHKY